MINSDSLDIVIVGLTLSSSWGNGHATTYRSLVKGLHEEGHHVTFLEQETKWYSSNRDLSSSPHCTLHFYENRADLENRFTNTIRQADFVMVGSYLQNGVDIGEFVIRTANGITAFYDIDTPVTLAKLDDKDYEYIHPELIPEYHIYLSFSGGKVLSMLESDYKASSAKPLYCSVDTDIYFREPQKSRWQLGYLGTYSSDRQPTLNRLLLETATEKSGFNFVVAGPQYPDDIQWPENVTRIEHLPPAKHRDFYNRQLFTLNVTRSAMIKTGFSPSVRLFEAAACKTPIISDYWEGMGQFFEPGREILIAESAGDVKRYLEYPEEEIKRISNNAYEKIMQNHTSRKRAIQLVSYIREIKKEKGRNIPDKVVESE